MNAAQQGACTGQDVEYMLIALILTMLQWAIGQLMRERQFILPVYLLIRSVWVKLANVIFELLSDVILVLKSNYASNQLKEYTNRFCRWEDKKWGGDGWPPALFLPGLRKWSR